MTEIPVDQTILIILPAMLLIIVIMLFASGGCASLSMPLKSEGTFQWQHLASSGHYSAWSTATNSAFQRFSCFYHQCISQCFDKGVFLNPLKGG